MFGLVRGDNPDLVPADSCCSRAAFPGGANAFALSVLQEGSGHGDGIIVRIKIQKRIPVSV